MQCMYSCTIFILYLLDRVIYFIEIHVEIIQMYLFSIKCKFYCIILYMYSLKVYLLIS